MNTGLFLSLLVNVLVGAYFVWFYPRSVRKSFTTGQVPRGFAILLKILPPVGTVLMVGSVLYGVLLVAGAFGG